MTCKVCNGPVTRGGWCLSCGPTDEQLATIAEQCERCRFRELEPIGAGRERFIGRVRMFLCDACWLEVDPTKGDA